MKFRVYSLFVVTASLSAAGLITPFVAQADYQCWSSTSSSNPDPTFTTVQPSNKNSASDAYQLCASSGGTAVYDTSKQQWTDSSGIRQTSPFASTYDCPSGETYSSQGASGQGSCVPLPNGYMYSQLMCREPSGNSFNVQNAKQCSGNDTLINNSSSACEGQWIADGSSWKCQPFTITKPSQLSDACLNNPSSGCTEQENAFLNGIKAAQTSPSNQPNNPNQYIGQDYSCQSGYTWSSTGGAGNGGCVPLPSYTPPTPSSPPPPVSPTSPISNKLTYIPLEPLPGGQSVYTGASGELSQYLNRIFLILLAIGAMIAVVTLVYGGISYMVSEVVHVKDGAKRRMRAAVGGLLLLLVCWLILNTINPNLTKINISIQGAKIAPAQKNPGISAGTPLDPTTKQKLADDLAGSSFGSLELLQDAKIIDKNDTAAKDAFNAQCQSQPSATQGLATAVAIPAAAAGGLVGGVAGSVIGTPVLGTAAGALAGTAVTYKGVQYLISAAGKPTVSSVPGDNYGAPGQTIYTCEYSIPVL